MAVQSILVGMDWGEATGALATVAPDLAIALGATIQAVYVEDVELIRATRMPPVPLLPPMGAIPFDTTSTAELDQKFKREESRLGKLFVQLVADTRIKGSFLVERGDVAEILVRESRAHDLLVLGRFSEKATEPTTLGAHVERIVRKAYCPVLLVPPGSQLGDRLLVAYDGSAGAHHALAFALPVHRMSAQAQALGQRGAEVGVVLHQQQAQRSGVGAGVHAVPKWVSKRMPTLRSSGVGSSPPAHTMTASLRSVCVSSPQRSSTCAASMRSTIDPRRSCRRPSAEVVVSVLPPKLPTEVPPSSV